MMLHVRAALMLGAERTWGKTDDMKAVKAFKKALHALRKDSKQDLFLLNLNPDVAGVRQPQDR